MRWKVNRTPGPFRQLPIGSMYAIYGNIYHQYTPNVSIYTIHGSYGLFQLESRKIIFWIRRDRFASQSNRFCAWVRPMRRLRDFCLAIGVKCDVTVSWLTVPRKCEQLVDCHCVYRIFMIHQVGIHDGIGHHNSHIWLYSVKKTVIIYDNLIACEISRYLVPINALFKSPRTVSDGQGQMF